MDGENMIYSKPKLTKLVICPSCSRGVNITIKYNANQLIYFGSRWVYFLLFRQIKPFFQQIWCLNPSIFVCCAGWFPGVKLKFPLKNKFYRKMPRVNLPPSWKTPLFWMTRTRVIAIWTWDDAPLSEFICRLLVPEPANRRIHR